MNKIIIAIDGPASSGKSTTARAVAEKIGYVYIDTGAMYRAVTLAWMRSGKELNDASLKEIADSISIELHNSPLGQRTVLNGEDVSEDIRMPEVTKWVSPVSADSYVRQKMVALQQELGKNGAVVMDGRDIGTTVFPSAELKIFLVASVEARAKRRTLELLGKGIDANFEEIKQQLTARDNYDSTREVSPLRKADDAIEIDTSDMTIEQQTAKVIELFNSIK